MKDRFDEFETDFLEFNKVENKRSLRSDLHAFLLLNMASAGHV